MKQFKLFHGLMVNSVALGMSECQSSELHMLPTVKWCYNIGAVQHRVHPSLLNCQCCPCILQRLLQINPHSIIMIFLTPINPPSGNLFLGFHFFLPLLCLRVCSCIHLVHLLCLTPLTPIHSHVPHPSTCSSILSPNPDISVYPPLFLLLFLLCHIMVHSVFKLHHEPQQWIQNKF